MVYCTTCGTQIAEGSFCTNCGTAAAPAPTASASYQRPAATNTLAIVALVTSLLGIGLAGIICGHISLGQIKQTNEQGKGMALAGLIIGYVSTAFIILAVIGFFALFAMRTPSYYDM
jgi:hypothetical protein